MAAIMSPEAHTILCPSPQPLSHVRERGHARHRSAAFPLLSIVGEGGRGMRGNNGRHCLTFALTERILAGICLPLMV